MEVIRALYDRVPGMVAVKDDILGDFGIELCTTVHDWWAVVSGGLMENHTFQLSYGVDGYLCALMSFKPEITWDYWDCVQANDYEAAWKIIREKEMPL